MAEQVSLYQRFTAGQPFALFGGDAGLPPIPTPAAGLSATSVVWTVRNAASDPDPGVLQKTSLSGFITIVDAGATSRAVVCTATLTANDTLLIGSSTLRQHDLKITWSDGSSSTVYAGPILASPQLGSPQNAVASVTVTPSGPSVVTGATQQMTAAPKDAGNAAVVVGILWSSDAPAIATVDPSSGVVTGVSVGTARIVASAPNGVCGDVVATVVAAGNSSLPPAAQASLALAFDAAYGQGGQTHTPRVGPVFQLGSTSGTDTSDPTYVSAAPSRYTFSGIQYLTAGDVLNATWTDPTGFTIMCGIDYESGDTSDSFVLSKASSGQECFYVDVAGGLPFLKVFDGADANTYEYAITSAAIATGRHVLVCRYDRSKPRGSRIDLWIDGAMPAQSQGTLGSGSVVRTTTAPLTIGAGLGIKALGISQNHYAWTGALTNQNISDNSAWLKTTMGWQ